MNSGEISELEEMLCEMLVLFTAPTALLCFLLGIVVGKVLGHA